MVGADILELDAFEVLAGLLGTCHHGELTAKSLREITDRLLHRRAVDVEHSRQGIDYHAVAHIVARGFECQPLHKGFGDLTFALEAERGSCRCTCHRAAAYRQQRSRNFCRGYFAGTLQPRYDVGYGIADLAYVLHAAVADVVSTRRFFDREYGKATVGSYGADCTLYFRRCDFYGNYCLWFHGVDINVLN